MSITFFGFGGQCITTLGWGRPSGSGIVDQPQCLIDMQSLIDLFADLDSEIDLSVEFESFADTVADVESEVDTQVSLDSQIDLVANLESAPC